MVISVLLINKPEPQRVQNMPFCFSELFIILVDGLNIASPMKLLSEVALPKYPFQLDHQSPILMMGSCFTENIGQLLDKYLFPVMVNPFGVNYNPLSVKKGLEALIYKEAYEPDDLDSFNDLWLSFDHDTWYSSARQDEALDKINKDFLGAKEMLKRAGTLFITWGTAWIYRFNPSGEVVCNCHKIPASQFTRSRLSTRDIIREYEEMIPLLLKFNPRLKIVNTVSPVRHWKDGAHGNQLSKSTLLLAGETLRESFPEQFFYFPSYEILMDELRDYRFYTEDLFHINNLGITYIWERFVQAFLSKDSKKIIADLETMLKFLSHRPMRTEGDSYEKLLLTREEKLSNLKKRYPELNWLKLGEE
jgi:hypothetical protein